MDDDGEGLTGVGVYARIRPSKGRDASVVVKKRFDTQKDVCVRNLEFSLDWVFDSDAEQEAVYEIVGEHRVALVPQGYNVCLLAYGQTGSGKVSALSRAAPERSAARPRDCAMLT